MSKTPLKLTFARELDAEDKRKDYSILDSRWKVSAWNVPSQWCLIFPEYVNQDFFFFFFF